MDLIEPKKIIDFLQKNEFSVVLKQVRRGVELRFPEIKTKFLKKPAKVISYIVKRGKNPGVIINDDTKTTVELPEYVTKSFIITRIISECNNFGYDYHYLILNNKNDIHVSTGIEEIESFIPSLKGLKKKKEDILIEIIGDLGSKMSIEDAKKLAEKYEVIEGFNILIGLIQQKAKGEEE